MSFLAPSDGRTDRRIRIKLCGMTRAEDVDAAISLDVDALGFVFYRPSPRYVTTAVAARLVARVPPSIATVGLFVDAPRDEIDAILDAVPLSLLQFHGDESPADCAGFRVPHLRAARMTPELDLLTFAEAHRQAAALLLDAHTAAYGGSGKVFDWSLVPPQLLGTADAPSRVGARRVVLSGGLNAANVADAIARVRPFAVDTSSGIESARGIKDPTAMRAFVAAVRRTDPLSS
jgi:phosphoribosylanthranilate isomerase